LRLAVPVVPSAVTGASTDLPLLLLLGRELGQRLQVSLVHILVALRMLTVAVLVDAARSASTLVIVVVVMMVVMVVTPVRAWRGHR
jgi:hypothetical protein